MFRRKRSQQVEHKNKRIYIHSSYGIEISEPDTLCCYVGIYNVGKVALGMGFVYPCIIVIRRLDKENINIKMKY